MSNIPRDILLIVREYLIHPADYFRLRRSCQHTSLMPREFPVVMHSLLRICSESRFPMTSSECSKLHLVGTGERIGITDLRRGQVETLLSCLTSECGVGMFCRILDLKLVDPFLLFDSAMKLDRSDIGFVCLQYLPFKDHLRMWRRLRAAVMRGYLEIVRVLVAGGIPSRTLEPDSDSLLHAAIVHDRADVVDFLLTTLPDLTETDADGLTPFLLACRDQRTLIVQKLLAFDSTVIGQRDNEGRSCLSLTLRPGPIGMDSAKLFEILLDTGAEFRTVVMPNGTLLIHHACAINRLDVVKLLVLRGVLVTQTDSLGRSCLDVANLSFGMVSCLLEQQVPLKPTVDYVGKAAAHNELHSCELLVHHGAAVLSPDSLLTAVSTTNKNAEAVQFIINLGVDPKQPAANGETALYRAVVYRNLDACKLLLEANADPNTAFKSLSMVNIAEREGFTDIAELLYAYGASTTNTLIPFQYSS